MNKTFNLGLAAILGAAMLSASGCHVAVSATPYYYDSPFYYDTYTYNYGYDYGYYNSGYYYNNSGYTNNSGSYYNNGYTNNSSSVAGDTKDVDLQASQAEEARQTERATNVANRFGMDFEAAVKLTKLADHVLKMSQQGQMSAADQGAVVESALNIAGLTTAETDQAATALMQNGNANAMNDLLAKGAKNLGMSSAAGLRDQLLPALGVSL